ncbi:MAG: hypothetical protein AAB573_02880 [Patescibacteria group bacterium]
MEYILLFHITFLLNFVWEVWHSQLYTTCRSMPLSDYVPLITFQSLKDALWVTLAYVLAPSILFFVAGLFIFSFIVEIHAIQTKRWEYASEMPLFFGVGISPFFELVITGLLALALIQFY